MWSEQGANGPNQNPNEKNELYFAKKYGKSNNTKQRKHVRIQQFILSALFVYPLKKKPRTQQN